MPSPNTSRYIDRFKKLWKVALGKAYVYSKESYGFHNLSFSQEGEDRILARLFEQQKTGFYVDVGAHHPQRFSNTYYFYLKGWRGINIDAMPGSMELFDQLRSEDINLEIPISEKADTLTYYEFNEPALNGFDAELSQSRDGLRDFKIVAKTQLKTRTLSDVLDKYLPPNQVIDFLSVDVEGLDLQVLQSNDWTRYRPRLVLAEDLSRKGMNEDSTLKGYMSDKGYRLWAKSFNTLFFKLEI